MKVIVGLGNPGPEYERTRHNAGFLAVDALAEELRATWSADKDRKSLVAKATLNGTNFLLAKPQTFMNLSGEAVQFLLTYYKIESSDVLVVQDELDLAPGVMAFTSRAGTAGHNGIASIFEKTNLTDIARLRIGIGRPTNQIPTEDWVLQNMEPATMESITKSRDALRDWIRDGLTITMNTWNRKS